MGVGKDDKMTWSFMLKTVYYDVMTTEMRIRGNEEVLESIKALSKKISEVLIEFEGSTVSSSMASDPIHRNPDPSNVAP